MSPRPRPEKQQQARTRRRAWTAMRILTCICALVALGIGTSQLASGGFATFASRPEGVGATPPDDEVEPSAPSTPAPANDGGAPTPSPLPGAQPAPDAPDHRPDHDGRGHRSPEPPPPPHDRDGHGPRII